MILRNVTERTRHQTQLTGIRRTSSGSVAPPHSTGTSSSASDARAGTGQRVGTCTKSVRSRLTPTASHAYPPVNTHTPHSVHSLCSELEAEFPQGADVHIAVILLTEIKRMLLGCRHATFWQNRHDLKRLQRFRCISIGF